jgi:RNA polymerase sigma-70 factor (ECF subfamily)
MLARVSDACVDGFLASLATGPQEDASREELRRVLSELTQRAREAWPGIALDDRVFAESLGLAVRHERDPIGTVLTLRTSELYLATACAQGDPRALAAFEKRFLARVPDHVKGIDPSPAFAADVSQALRATLLLAEADARPRIAEFGGRGTLAAWVRVCAIRTALNLRRTNLRRGRGHVAADDDVLGALPAPGADPEFDYVRAVCRDEFARAFADALAALAPKQRSVLRVHHLDGLTLDQTARAFQVGRATVARWLAQAREQLLEETKRLLKERLQLSATDLESVLRYASHRLDVSLRRRLSDTR